MNNRRVIDGAGAFAVAEDAVALWRAAPPAVWAIHSAGTISFVIGLLYSWSALASTRADAADTAGCALLLAVLFHVMKTAQAVAAARLFALAEGDAPPAFGVRSLIRIFGRQVLLQTTGLLALPLSVVLVLPFGWVHAYYQNLTVYGARLEWSLDEVRRRAREQARLWPRQNHVLIWLVSPWPFGAALAISFAAALLLAWIARNNGSGLLRPSQVLFAGLALFAFNLWPCSPLGFLIAINVALTAVALPFLVTMLFGIRTPFDVGGIHAFANATFLGIVWGAVFLVLDPVIKAAHVLRCFHGASRHTGADLRARLRRLAAAGLLVLLLFLPGATLARADTPPPLPAASIVKPQQLRAEVRAVLDGPAYRWRLPAEETRAASSWLAGTAFWRFSERCAEWARNCLSRLADWVERLLDRLLRRDKPDTPSSNHEPVDARAWLVPLFWMAFAAVLCGAVIYYLRSRRRAARLPARVGQALTATMPDVVDERTLASALPADEWQRLALELAGRGEWRSALRAWFLSLLASLDARHLVRVQRYKTNADYAHELARRAHAMPALAPLFGESARVFEESWYGTCEVTEERLGRFRQMIEELERQAV
jgi:hypothetical protein